MNDNIVDWPWEVVYGNNHTYSIAHKNLGMVIPWETADDTHLVGCLYCKHEAVLMATAPELLNAVEKTLDWLRFTSADKAGDITNLLQTVADKANGKRK